MRANDRLMRKLNKNYRKKSGSTNILSFPLSKSEGEIFINIPLAKKEAERAKIPAKKYIDYLFIHSLLHLKGHTHGEKMRKEENKIMKKLWGEIL